MLICRRALPPKASHENQMRSRCSRKAGSPFGDWSFLQRWCSRFDLGFPLGPLSQSVTHFGKGSLGNLEETVLQRGWSSARVKPPCSGIGLSLHMGSGTEGTGQEAQYGSHVGPALTVGDRDSVI